MDYSDLKGQRILVMGLGAHGGGAASARFFAEAGAVVTVTDLRTEDELAESVESLADLPISFVLGEHRREDFTSCDLVIKNPAVPRTVSLLQLAPRIETDISVFLALTESPVVAVTGTKGKSTTASILTHVLRTSGKDVWLGGNITVSPLTFFHQLKDHSVTVLELSSFQLGDLLLSRNYQTENCRMFSAVAITNLLPDHLDYYGSMEEYAADKAVIFERPSSRMPVVLSDEDPFSRAYDPPPPAQTIRIVYSTGQETRAYKAKGAASSIGEEELLPPDWEARSRHLRKNAFFAAILAFRLGVQATRIRTAIPTFPGVPHRLEQVGWSNGVRFVNDSAATIQEACMAAVQSCEGPVHLIAGGSDKGVPVDRFPAIAEAAASIHLLSGTATEQIVVLLRAKGVPFTGPHASMKLALQAAERLAQPGDTVLLSPGCASFGMFRNEFDRGDQFRRLVQESGKP